MKREKVLVLFWIFMIAVCRFPFAEDVSIPPKQERPLQETIPNIVKKISSSVVVVLAYDKENNLVAQGSGFFIDDRGDVLTNCHVLKEAYRAEIKVSEKVVYPVKKIISEDEVGDLIRISVDIPKEEVKPLPIADTIPETGERILVIGSPFGLERTVSDGIVAAVREIPEFGKIIQITASVSAGSSGSPVVNMNGEVFGVATFCFAEAQNLNFAMPVKRILTFKQEEKTFAERKGEDVEESLFSKAFNCFMKGENKEVIYYCKEMLKGDAEDRAAYGLMVLAYEALGRWADAVEVYKQIIRIKSDYVDYSGVYNKMGIAYYNLNLYDKSIEAYKQAIRIRPDESVLHYNLGLAYSQIQRHQEAVSAYKQAIRINPDYAEAHWALGVSYGVLRYATESIEAFKQAIRINPNWVNAHYSLGAAYYLLNGDKGSALEEYKILKNLDKDWANKLFNLIYQ